MSPWIQHTFSTIFLNFCKWIVYSIWTVIIYFLFYRPWASDNTLKCQAFHSGTLTSMWKELWGRYSPLNTSWPQSRGSKVIGQTHTKSNRVVVFNIPRTLLCSQWASAVLDPQTSPDALYAPWFRTVRSSQWNAAQSDWDQVAHSANLTHSSSLPWKNSLLLWQQLGLLSCWMMKCCPMSLD